MAADDKHPLVEAIVQRVEAFQRRRHAEADTRRHVIATFAALRYGDIAAARARISAAAASLATLESIPPPAPTSKPDPAMPSILRRLKRRRLGRFTYWADERINPEMEWAAEAGHSELSRQFQEAFADDSEAIFDFARQDARVFRAAWVIDQIERWEANRNAPALRKLMRAYTEARGKTSRQEVSTLAARDQGLYLEYRTALRAGKSKNQAIAVAAGTSDHDDASHVEARNVCKHYDAYLALFRQFHPAATEDAFFTHLSTLLAALKDSGAQEN